MDSILGTTTTLTPSEAAAAGAIVGSTFSIVMFSALAFYILLIIACWKIFEKAGEKGWKSLIPFYNIYIMYKIVDMKNWFWAVLAVTIVGSIIMGIDGTSSIMTGADAQSVNIGAHPLTIIVMLVELVVGVWASILYAWRTSKVFGHDIGYCLGLLFLPQIFQLILGFGKSKYNKKNLKK